MTRFELYQLNIATLWEKIQLFKAIRIWILRGINFNWCSNVHCTVSLGFLFWFSFCCSSKEIDFVLAVQFVSHQRLIVSQETKIKGPTILVVVSLLFLVKSIDFFIQWQLDILSVATNNYNRITLSRAPLTRENQLVALAPWTPNFSDAPLATARMTDR